MTIVLIAIALYLLAVLLLVKGMLHQVRRVSHAWLLPALPAVALHAGFHLLAWRNAGGTDLHFFSALSLVGLGMALLTLLVGARGRMATLGVVVFPPAPGTLGPYADSGYPLAHGPAP